jgi:O-antigen ligase
MTETVRLDRLRLVVLCAFASVPILAVWPPDVFDPFFGIKALAVILLGLATACWWVLVGISPSRPALRLTPLLACWTGLVLWLALSTVLSVDPPGAVWGSPGREDGLLVWLAGLSVFALACTTTRDRNWRTVWNVALLTALVVAAFAVAQRFGFDPLSSAVARARGRSSATLRNPLFLGGYLALIAPLAVAWCMRAQGVTRKACGALGVGMVLAGLYFTFSRAAWLGTAGGVALLGAWVMWRHLRDMRVFVLVLAGACAVAGVLGLLPSPSLSVVETHSLGKDAVTAIDVGDARNSGRVAIWQISLRMIGDRPWFGVGLDQMGTVFDQYRTARFDEAEGPEVFADRAHSDPLQLAVTGGIPAAALFYVLVGTALWRSRKRWRRTDRDAIMWAATAAGVLGYVAQSLVSITVPGVHALFLLLLGGLAALNDPLPVKEPT